MVYKDIDNVLATYDFSEILELNEITEAEVLLLLVDEGHIKLPDPRPLDFND